MIDVQKDGTADSFVKYSVTLAIDSRFDMPVHLTHADLLHVDGTFSGGPNRVATISLNQDVPPGRTIITAAGDLLYGLNQYPTSFQVHNDGILVTNTYYDQLNRSKYCSYANVVIGPPHTGIR